MIRPNIDVRLQRPQAGDKKGTTPLAVGCVPHPLGMERDTSPWTRARGTRPLAGGPRTEVLPLGRIAKLF